MECCYEKLGGRAQGPVLFLSHVGHLMGRPLARGGF